MSIKITHSRKRPCGLAVWLALVARRANNVRSCSLSHERARRDYRQINKDMVWKCQNASVLKETRSTLIEGRNRRYPWRYPLSHAFSRAEFGALIVEIDNQLSWIERGRPAPRAKGPTFDPARIPDDRLNALIQSHPDLAIVDRLRHERALRQER